MAVLVMGAVAQPRGLSKEDQEKVFNGKARKMQKELKLSDEQMVKFLPVYKEFQQEVMGIKRNRVKRDSLTMDKAYDIAMSKLNYQEEVIKVQKNTLAKLRTILTPKQLISFLDAERSVQMDIHKFKKGRKGAKGQKKDMRKRMKMKQKMSKTEGDSEKVVEAE